jgi:hypothetical protein
MEAFAGGSGAGVGDFDGASFEADLAPDDGEGFVDADTGEHSSLFPRAAATLIDDPLGLKPASEMLGHTDRPAPSWTASAATNGGSR